MNALGDTMLGRVVGQTAFAVHPAEDEASEKSGADLHGGPHVLRNRLRVPRVVPSLRPRRGPSLRSVAFVAEYVIIGAVAVGILFYLAYALLFPERF